MTGRIQVNLGMGITQPDAHRDNCMCKSRRIMRAIYLFQCNGYR